MVVVVVLGLGAAVFYGASDFFAALAARRLNLITATTGNYAVAMVGILLGLLLVGGAWSGDAVLFGALTGVLAVVGLLAFYGVLAIGPMSLLSPIIALVQSAVPVTVAAITGQGLSVVAWFAIGLAVVAILLLSPPPHPGRDRISRRGALLAVFSGLMLGASTVTLDFAPKDSGVLPAVSEIASGLIVLGILLAAIRFVGPRSRWSLAFEPVPTAARAVSPRRAWIQAAVAGLLVAVADALITLALHVGNLAVVAVLTALYPVITVILAATVLKERMTALQFVGVALVITASLLLSASGQPA
jgi:uncharacterized membrane protein